MPNYSHAQVVGFLLQVIEAWKKLLPRLRKHVDADALLQELMAAQEEVASLKAEKDALRRKLDDVSRRYWKKRRRAYVFGSGMLDTMIAVFRQAEEDPSTLRRIRTGLRHRRQGRTAEE